MQGPWVQILARELNPTHFNEDLAQLNKYIFLISHAFFETLAGVGKGEQTQS